MKLRSPFRSISAWQGTICHPFQAPFGLGGRVYGRCALLSASVSAVEMRPLLFNHPGGMGLHRVTCDYTR